MSRAISLESKILIVICVADMLSTLIAVLSGFAAEQNPLMAACLRHSIWTFVAVKTASFVPFVVAIEYYRAYNPVFARNACRAAILLYVFVYVSLTLKVNVI